MSFHDCYVLTRQVHKGIISVVWECVHRVSCRRYAVKIIDRRRLSKRGEAAIYREVKMLESVDPKTPGTIHLCQIFDEQSHVYIVSEYAQGGNLRARIERKKRLSEDETKNIIRSILQCLVQLHRSGMVHRNLKPDNILLHGVSALIADYGHATHVMYNDSGEMLPFTAQCGTSNYVAPEILNKQPYTSQVDMWSVGIIAYMCLAGYHPFADHSKQILLSNISKSVYTFNPEDWASISRTAKQFISSLLHVDPTVRFTAEEALQHPWLAPPIIPTDDATVTSVDKIHQSSTTNPSSGLQGAFLASPGRCQRRRPFWRCHQMMRVGNNTCM